MEKGREGDRRELRLAILKINYLVVWQERKEREGGVGRAGRGKETYRNQVDIYGRKGRGRIWNWNREERGMDGHRR